MGLAVAAGLDVRTTDGAAGLIEVGVGAKVAGRSSTNWLMGLSAAATFLTEISFGLAPSLSLTSKKPGGLSSTSVYSPGGRHRKSNSIGAGCGAQQGHDVAILEHRAQLHRHGTRNSDISSRAIVVVSSSLQIES